MSTLALLLVGCSESPTTTVKKAPEPPPEPVTGRKALYQMYQVARSWAPDAEVLKLNSINLQEVKSEPGKAGAWQGTFTSARLSKVRSYTYSVVEAPGNLHKGTFAGLEDSWSGPRGTVKPFVMAALKSDSDAAHEAAMKQKKVTEYAKKNPEMAMNYLLEQTSKFKDFPVWRVIWGDSVGTSNFSVYVNASTGDYLEIMH